MHYDGTNAICNLILDFNKGFGYEEQHNNKAYTVPKKHSDWAMNLREYKTIEQNTVVADLKNNSLYVFFLFL